MEGSQTGITGRGIHIFDTLPLVNNNYSLLHLSLKLFNTTDTELKAIAALANIGFSSKPFTGNRIPAANGMPIRL